MFQNTMAVLRVVDCNVFIRRSEPESQSCINPSTGDVVLKDLRLKDSALQDLDLPIKTVSGYLGKYCLLSFNTMSVTSRVHWLNSRSQNFRL